MKILIKDGHVSQFDAVFHKLRPNATDFHVTSWDMGDHTTQSVLVSAKSATDEMHVVIAKEWLLENVSDILK